MTEYSGALQRVSLYLDLGDGYMSTNAKIGLLKKEKEKLPREEFWEEGVVYKVF